MASQLLLLSILVQLCLQIVILFLCTNYAFLILIISIIEFFRLFAINFKHNYSTILAFIFFGCFKQIEFFYFAIRNIFLTSCDVIFPLFFRNISLLFFIVSQKDIPNSLMSLQKCVDISEALPLEVGLGLYLKPAAKIKISVQLPKLKTPGQSISTFQVMERLRAVVRPDLFLTLKALKITSAVIKFLGELETRAAADRALARLQAAGSIRLAGFSEWLQIRAAHALCSGPTRHDWDSFFRDARGVNEMKPGERPDTVHLLDLPTSWFSESNQDSSRPSESVLHKAFSTFGRIRRLEIPADSKSPSDDERTFGKTSSLFRDSTFEVYVQYEEYVEFATAMDTLRGKKLIYKDESERKIFSAEIKVQLFRQL